MYSMDITSRIKNYRVYFCEDADMLIKLFCEKEAIFLIDARVYTLYKAHLLSHICKMNHILLEIDEEHKNLDYVSMLYSRIMAFAPKKNCHIISIGGGITQDITGFLASCLYRGVRLSFIPTTLLAQTDSCIGAKTSLNFLGYKNLLGTFFPPHAIYIYAPFLKTLSMLDRCSGLGEMAKFHLLLGGDGARNFARKIPLLLNDNSALFACVQECLEVKKRYIEADEFDTGCRNILNFGHCFGHALESASDFAIPHGLAVVLGMMLANHIARSRGLLASDEECFIATSVLSPLLACLSLPPLDIDMVLQAMAKDKKNTATDNRLPCILLTQRLNNAQTYSIMQANNTHTSNNIDTAKNTFLDSINPHSTHANSAHLPLSANTCFHSHISHISTIAHIPPPPPPSKHSRASHSSMNALAYIFIKVNDISLDEARACITQGGDIV